MAEIVNHPAHYQTAAGVEAIEVMERYALGPHLFVAMKHLLRAGRKADLLTDLRKAEWYIRRVDPQTLFLRDDCVADMWLRPDEIAEAFDLDGPRRSAVVSILDAATATRPERRAYMRRAVEALREAIEQAEAGARQRCR